MLFKKKKKELSINKIMAWMHSLVHDEWITCRFEIFNDGSGAFEVECSYENRIRINRFCFDAPNAIQEAFEYAYDFIIGYDEEFASSK